MPTRQEYFKELGRNIASLMFHAWILQSDIEFRGIHSRVLLMKEDIARAVKLRKFIIRG